MLLTCACTPGMDGTKPTITVADKQKETASLWKLIMVDAVSVVVIEFRRISKIYVIVEQVFSSTFRERRRRLRLHFPPAVPVFGNGNINILK